MESKHFRIAGIFIPLVILIFLVFSCKKDPYTVGLNLLPPSDTLNVKTSDTASFVAYSVLQDTVRTDETAMSMVGSLMDPIFGSTTANFYMQYWLSQEAPDFGSHPVLDSVILMLPYGNIYGDTNALQTLNVYELSEDIFYDSAYYSNHSLKNYGTPLANYTFRPAQHDSVTIRGVKIAPHIRIRLDKLTKYFGNKLLTAPSTILNSNVNFIEYMKGLYIESMPVHSGGALLAFDPTNALSDIAMYYHNATDDSLEFDLVGGSQSARFNYFDHKNYISAAPDFRQQVIQHDTMLGRNKLYIQGLGGVRVHMRLPFLKDFGKSGKIAINSAVLTFKNAETDTSLQPPVSLTLVVVDSAGRVGFLTDENEGVGYFGGTYNTSARTYKFRITQHLQLILDGKVKNYDMYLQANNPTAGVLVPNRVSFTGTKPFLPGLAADEVKLQVIYTKLH